MKEYFRSIALDTNSLIFCCPTCRKIKVVMNYVVSKRRICRDVILIFDGFKIRKFTFTIMTKIPVKVIFVIENL